MQSFRIIFFNLAMLIFYHVSICQVLLQVEIPHQIEAVKFGSGDQITFKTKDRKQEWQKRTIDHIIHGDDIIVFDDGMVVLKDITHFRIYNNTAKAFGHVFLGFGGGWFVFGGIATLAGKYTFTAGTLAIGATALLVGWILNKIVSKRTFRIGKNANLRIIDINFQPRAGWCPYSISQYDGLPPRSSYG